MPFPRRFQYCAWKSGSQTRNSCLHRRRRGSWFVPHPSLEGSCSGCTGMCRPAGRRRSPAARRRSRWPSPRCPRRAARDPRWRRRRRGSAWNGARGSCGRTVECRAREFETLRWRTVADVFVDESRKCWGSRREFHLHEVLLTLLSLCSCHLFRDSAPPIHTKQLMNERRVHAVTYSGDSMFPM